MKSRIVPDLQDPPNDSIFSVIGDEIYASFIPSAANEGRNPVPDVLFGTTTTSTSTTAQSTSGSVVAVTSGGMTINLLFDAAAMAAPASFRAGIQQAAALLSAAISDKITVNLKIDYSGTGGGAAAGPDQGLYESYSSIRTDLINGATPGDATFNALPSGSSVQGQSSVAVWNAQLKLWGLLGANDTTTDDGSATFATDINSNLLAGVALHELTHALGRVPYGRQPDIFDLFRFTSPGARLFLGGATAPAAYLSVDGGNTKLADYGQNSDASDFLNSGVQGPNDPFNEFYTSSTLQQFTAVDLKQLDALGFHISTPDTQAPTIGIDSPLSIPAGTTETITSDLLSASDNVSSAVQLHFTVTTVPTDGTLWLNGAATSSFTQADINNGLVSYHETASGATSDSFLFTVTDAAGNATGVASFQINIGSPNHAADTLDFNGDGNTDLLFTNNTTNGVAVWLMSGAQVTANAQVGTLAAGWHYAAYGDFNADGKTDLLMLNDTTHDVAIWEMNGTTVVANQTIGTINAAGGWHFADTGDFNGDGKTDLLFVNNTTNGVAVWQIDGKQVTANPQVGIMAAGWHYAATGDFNGDGKTDLLMLNDTTHDVAIWQMNGTQVTANPQIGTINAAAGWHFADTGDFNGDGKTDLLMLNDTTHGVAIWQMNGPQVTANPQIGTINAAAGWHFADTGDFNGDGKTDLLFLNDTTHGVAIWQMNGTQVTSNPQVGTIDAGFSYAGLGDFNGDHKTDLLFENDTTHAVTMWEMNGTQIALNQQIGTINAAADWHLVA
jgi:hypothetical protein